MALDFGLPVDRIVEPLRRAVTDEETGATNTVVEAVDRRGRAFTCVVRTLPLRTASQGLRGAIILMAEQQGAGDLPFVGDAQTV